MREAARPVPLLLTRHAPRIPHRMKVRLERVREMLKRTLGEIIRRDFPPTPETGLLTINDVIVTADLKEAKVFVGVVGKPEVKKRAMKLLAEKRGLVQYELGRAIVLRWTPVISCHLDESVERGNRILAIMEEVEKLPLAPAATPAHPEPPQ